MKILAIDPGTTHSAYAAFVGFEHPVVAEKLPNLELRDKLEFTKDFDVMVYEMVACYGMPVGSEVFETVLWTGRFIEVWNERSPVERLYRIEVKSHLCRSAKASDSNIRQAIIDRYGGKEKAIGNKKNPGPLYTIKGDMWAALAVAITYSETKGEERKDV